MIRSTVSIELMDPANDDTPIARLSGRKAQAARNDAAILDAARDVFVANPDAPISEVAARAGVGISALYRRYESKETLLAVLVADGLATFNRITADAIADEREPWAAFCDYMTRIVEADNHSLTVNLAGRFTPTSVHAELSARAAELGERLFARITEAGILRPGITFVELGILGELLASVRIGTDERRRELQRRYLAVLLDGLRAPGVTPLTGSPVTWEEQAARWASS
jgi:AcrR family transcriptional regulator